MKKLISMLTSIALFAAIAFGGSALAIAESDSAIALVASNTTVESDYSSLYDVQPLT